MVLNMLYAICILLIIITSFSLGVIIGTNKRKDLEIENTLLTKQLDKYKKHEEYKKLDVKVLDDDIELDKMMESIEDERTNR